jgi:PhnB protein
VAKGAKLLHPVKDQFYGDRTGNLEDPEGHIWHVATRVEEVPPKELKRRVAAMMAQSKTAS